LIFHLKYKLRIDDDYIKKTYLNPGIESTSTYFLLASGSKPPFSMILSMRILVLIRFRDKNIQTIPFEENLDPIPAFPGDGSNVPAGR
jgi:hypothetical protein